MNKNVEIFINLTAGLEHLKILYPIPLNFLRVQSTHLEQKHLEHVLRDLDNNFLMKLAIGRECIVLDYTSRKKKNNASRACWQGLSWIRYVVNRIWFNRHITCDYGMHLCFSNHFLKLSATTRKKIKYFKKFVMVDDINLRYICGPTKHDSDFEYYIGLVKKYMT